MADSGIGWVVFYFATSVAALAFIYAISRARKKESRETCMEDIVFKKPALPIVGAVFFIGIGLFMVVLLQVLNLTGNRNDPIEDLLGVSAFGAGSALIGLFFLLYRSKWDMRVENGVFIHRAMFQKDIIFPLDSVGRIAVGTMPSFGYDFMMIFDKSDKQLIQIRSSLKGYGLLHTRLVTQLSQNPPAPLP